MALAAIPEGTLALTIFQNNYETMAVSVEAADDQVARDHKERFEEMLEKEMAIDAPPGYTKWRSVKFLFRKTPDGYLRFKKHVVDGEHSQMINLEDFMQHDAIMPYMNGIISSVDFKDEVHNGKEIEKEEAIEASKEVDPKNKPVSSRRPVSALASPPRFPRPRTPARHRSNRRRRERAIERLHASEVPFEYSNPRSRQN